MKPFNQQTFNLQAFRIYIFESLQIIILISLRHIDKLYKCNPYRQKNESKIADMDTLILNQLKWFYLKLIF